MTELQLLHNTPAWDWPESAASLFLVALQDSNGDEADRLLAAEMAGDFMAINDDLAGALLDIVEDSSESEELRARAVISFGVALEYIDIDLDGFNEVDEYDNFAVTEQMYQRILKSLQSLYFDGTVPELVRRRTLEASVRSPQPWHHGAVRAAYQTQKENWIVSALFCMAYIRGFQQEILEALQSKISAIKYEAIRAAGNWGIADAWPDISEVLTAQDADKGLLMAAIDASVGIEHHEATAALEKLLDDSSDEDVIAAAHEAISMLDGDPYGDDD